MKKKQVDPSCGHIGQFSAVGRRGELSPARVTPRDLQPFTFNELRHIGEEITAQCFRPVETRHLTLMAIDPWNLHASWHIAGADLEVARAGLPGRGRGAVLLLRFADISPNNNGIVPHAHFDVEVDEFSSNRYVNLWRDARHYSAELGLRAADGSFVCLVRSNEVETPRAGPSPEFHFSERQVRAPDVPVDVPEAGRTDVSDFLLRDLFPRWSEPQDDAYPLADVGGLPSDDPLQEPAFPQLSAELSEIDIAQVLANSVSGVPLPRFGMAAANSEPSGDFPCIAAADIASWHKHALDKRSQVLAGQGSPMPQLPQLMPGMVAPTHLKLTPQPLPFLSATLPVVSPARVTAHVEGAASVSTETWATDLQPQFDASDMSDADEVTEAVDASATPSVMAQVRASGQDRVALEALLAGAVGSSAPGHLPLHVAAHLVIEGYVAPDTLLTLYGKPVPLQPGGQFSVALPLPRGPELATVLHHWRSHLNGWRER
jgi:hypothetical protein